MMIVGNASKVHGIVFADPAQMANALRVFTGEGIRIGIVLLMINAAVLGATAISLSSAWTYGEVRGWAHSLQLPFKQAKGFYVACVGLAAALVLIPRAPLQLIILSVQVLAGKFCPRPSSSFSFC